MNQQLYPSSPYFVARGFNPVVVNTTHRNWTMIGKLNNILEAIVDPRGLVTPSAISWSLDSWIYIDGKVYSPAKMKQVKQYLHKNMPAVVTEFIVKKKIAVKLVTFIGETENSTIYHKAYVQNISREDIDASFCFSIRPYNTEGISLNYKIEFQEDKTFYVNDVFGGYFLQSPTGSLTSHLSKGDVSLFVNETDDILRYAKGSSRVGMCTGLAKFDYYLSPGKSTEYEVRIPLNEKRLRKRKLKGANLDNLIADLKKPHFEPLLKKSVTVWKKKITEGLQIDVPDKKLMQAFEANKIFMLLFYDGDSITPGPAIYHHFWFRDASYMINALDKIGFHEEAEKILLTYPQRQRPNGFFKSQDGEWDSNGQSIWVLSEHYKLTNNEDFLKKVLPSIEKGARWILRKIKDNKKIDAGYKGLLPPGLSAEHFGLNDYYYWDNFWALGGLRETIQICQLFNHRTKSYVKGYEELDANIKSSLGFSEGHLGKPIIPISPSRRMDSAAAGSLCATYPLNLIPANDIRMKNTVDYLLNNCFINGGFFHDINHSGHNSYLNMHIAQCLIGQHNPEKAYDILSWLLDVTSPTFAWPEAIHPNTLGGCVGDGHHGWAAADFLTLIRNMLYKENGQHILTITPGMPLRWLKKENVIKVQNASTHFGRLDYSVKIVSNKKLEYTVIDKNLRSELTYFEIYVPLEIKNVIVGQKKVPFHHMMVRIPRETKKVTINLK